MGGIDFMDQLVAS